MSAKPSKYEEALLKEIRGVPKEHMPNLFGIVHLFKESVTLRPARESFGQGWQEVKAGKTEPVSELWGGIDAE